MNTGRPIGRVLEVLLPMLCCTRIKPSWYGQNSENRLPGDRPLSKPSSFAACVCQHLTSITQMSQFIPVLAIAACDLSVHEEVQCVAILCAQLHLSEAKKALAFTSLDTEAPGGKNARRLRENCFQTRGNLKQLVALTE